MRFSSSTISAIPYITIRTSDGSQIIHPTEIVRVEALSNYSKIFFSNGSNLVVSKVLSWFADKLPPQGFSRVHKSHIVNSSYLMVCHPIVQNMLRLQNGEQIPVSRRRKTGLMKSLSAP